jgi:hypothetical protein
MIRSSLRRTFCVNPKKGDGPFGVGGLFKKMLHLPKRFANLVLEPRENNSTYGNVTADAFDAVSQEWQAAIIGNSYDLKVMEYFDAVAQMNFGTIDNPHVIYTADIPFRYVGCTGQPNEDDYEGHEYLIFMLREGPLQRCPQCGQVYKLVRLRNEFSAEMDYYGTGLLPLHLLEMGEADHWSQNSLLRLMPNSFEHTQFEIDSLAAYSLVNPDEHDRILTDPAYRLEKIQKARNVVAVMNASLRALEEQYNADETTSARLTVPLNKLDYKIMIDVEVAIRKTDRIYKKLRKFHARQYLDIENHERREARMLKRQKQRTVDSYTVYFGGLSEQEQMMRDYFETDAKENPEDENALEIEDEEIIRSLDAYKTDKYDFQELYTRNATEDASGMEDRLVFRFVNRRAIDTVSDFERRQKRMSERSFERLAKLRAELSSQTASSPESLETVKGKYLDAIINESINQYADYFETEGEDAPEALRVGSINTKVSLLEGFKDYSQKGISQRGFYSIPKARWNEEHGVLRNLMHQVTDFSNYVLPNATELNNNIQQNLLVGKADRYIDDTSKFLDALSSDKNLPNKDK